jgi:NAD dependent epimerase/dehydratase family enzyme
MSRALGNALGRPAKMAVPRLVLKMMMGEMAEVLLGGQRAVPSRLTAAGFEFRYPEIEGALSDLVSHH